MIVVVLMAVIACGGDDPLANVDNCSDLLNAVTAHLEQLEDAGQTVDEFAEEVRELGSEMAGDAIARGAELEAVICTEAMAEVDGASFRETFDEIGSGLEE